MIGIEMISPEEDVGRDTLSRFDMQFQAAAFSALEILKGDGIDCVYCDYHDDFVVRRQVGGVPTYHFFQVKTKKRLNAQWKLSEVFAIKPHGQKSDKDSMEAVRKSFVGKLLLHGVLFDEQCSEVTLLSNIYFDQHVVTAVEELRGKSPQCKAANFLTEHFSAIFTLQPSLDESTAKKFLSKLSLSPAVSHIDFKPDAFTNAARAAIYRYSEIDLNHYETAELASSLLDLVFRKSKQSLESVKPTEIEDAIGINIDDLLKVLSISRTAYAALLAGEDEKALKTASVLQRAFANAGARPEMIEYAARQKVNWDLWLRHARHIYTEFDLEQLLHLLDSLYEKWRSKGARFEDLAILLDELNKVDFLSKFEGINKDILFGGVNSVIVRRYSI